MGKCRFLPNHSFLTLTTEKVFVVLVPVVVVGQSVSSTPDKSYFYVSEEEINCQSGQLQIEWGQIKLINSAEQSTYLTFSWAAVVPQLVERSLLTPVI